MTFPLFRTSASDFWIGEILPVVAFINFRKSSFLWQRDKNKMLTDSTKVDIPSQLGQWDITNALEMEITLGPFILHAILQTSEQLAVTSDEHVIVNKQVLVD